MGYPNSTSSSRSANPRFFQFRAVTCIRPVSSPEGGDADLPARSELRCRISFNPFKKELDDLPAPVLRMNTKEIHMDGNPARIRVAAVNGKHSGSDGVFPRLSGSVLPFLRCVFPDHADNLPSSDEGIRPLPCGQAPSMRGMSDGPAMRISSAVNGLSLKEV